MRGLGSEIFDLMTVLGAPGFGLSSSWEKDFQTPGRSLLALFKIPGVSGGFFQNSARPPLSGRVL